MSVLEGITDAELDQQWADIHKHSVPKREARAAHKITLETDAHGKEHQVERVDDMRGHKQNQKKRIRILNTHTGRTVFDTGWIWQSGGTAKLNKAKDEILLLEKARGDMF